MAMPYKDAHRPWEPLSVDAVMEYITINTLREDPNLFWPCMALVHRGFTLSPDLIIAIMHEADAALIDLLALPKGRLS